MITDEMVREALQVFRMDGSAEESMRKALERVFPAYSARLGVDEGGKWDRLDDEEVLALHAGVSERSGNSALPTSARVMASRLGQELLTEQRRRSGGYQGPGIYRAHTGVEFEVLGRLGSDGNVVLRDLSDGHLFAESWGEFNADLDGEPAYRYVLSVEG